MAGKSDVIEGFDKPTRLPKDNIQCSQWQNANRDWWENHPMRYDWKKSIAFKEFSREFFLEIDNRFFSKVKQFMPWREVPFDTLIAFNSLAGKDVLEIGTGNGSHAQLLAEYAKSYTGIDITDYAVKSTSERMKCFGISNAKIIRMDAEEMQFDNNSFDYVWSWGVIHHSSNTEKILKEMKRVLRPNGVAVTMVYHRSLWNYYIMCGLFLGVIKGDLFKTKSLHKMVQKHTDGAIARYYTISEWRRLVSNYFCVKDMQIYGSKDELIPLPAGRVKKTILALIPNVLSRFFTNRCKQGGFLVSILENK
jgi:ubiquinone/menaquinone biosynthesis C-methylase UbiE